MLVPDPIAYPAACADQVEPCSFSYRVSISLRPPNKKKKSLYISAPRPSSVATVGITETALPLGQAHPPPANANPTNIRLVSPLVASRQIGRLAPIHARALVIRLFLQAPSSTRVVFWRAATPFALCCVYIASALPPTNWAPSLVVPISPFIKSRQTFPLNEDVEIVQTATEDSFLASLGL